MTARGTWEDPAIVNDPRIAHDAPLVRVVAERLHANESMQMHRYIQGVICPYCALRASRCIRWFAEAVAGLPLTHDTPFGLILRDRETDAAQAGQERVGDAKERVGGGEEAGADVRQEAGGTTWQGYRAGSGDRT